MATYIPPKEWALIYDTLSAKFFVKKIDSFIAQNHWAYLRGVSCSAMIMGVYETREQALEQVPGLTPLLGFTKKYKQEQHI
jgi:hypothetical protein